MDDRPQSTFRRTSTFEYTIALLHAHHRVTLLFDQFSGDVIIRVDGTPVVMTRIGLRHAFTLTQRWEFGLGAAPHRMTIEARRRVFFAYLRPLRYRILIDGQFVTSLER